VNEEGVFGGGIVSMYDSESGAVGVGGVSSGWGGLGEEERCKGCLVDHLAQPPNSDPVMAPIQGCPTPSFPPVQTNSKGSLTPR